MAKKIGLNVYLTLSPDEYTVMVEALRDLVDTHRDLGRMNNARFVSEILIGLGETE